MLHRKEFMSVNSVCPSKYSIHFCFFLFWSPDAWRVGCHSKQLLKCLVRKSNVDPSNALCVLLSFFMSEVSYSVPFFLSSVPISTHYVFLIIVSGSLVLEGVTVSYWRQNISILRVFTLGIEGLVIIISIWFLLWP